MADAVPGVADVRMRFGLSQCRTAAVGQPALQSDGVIAARVRWLIHPLNIVEALNSSLAAGVRNPGLAGMHTDADARAGENAGERERGLGPGRGTMDRDSARGRGWRLADVVGGVLALVRGIGARRWRDDPLHSLAEIVEDSPDWVVKADAGLRVTCLNPAARAVFGEAGDGAGGRRRLAELFDPATAGELQRILETARRQRVFRGEGRMLAGTVVPVSLVVVAHRGAGDVAPWFSLIAHPLAAVPARMPRDGDGQLGVRYQPWVEIERGEVAGVECFPCWAHPQLGALGSIRPVPPAAEGEQAPALAVWVLERACRETAAWRDEGIAVPLTVNVSVHEFSRSGFPGRIEALVARYGLAPGQLGLEVSAEALLSCSEAAIANLRELRSRGVRITLDEFDARHVLSGRLRELPLDRLKIGRRAVVGAARDRNKAATVEAAVGLGRLLGLEVIAEGVENTADLATLVDLGCSRMQGWLFHRVTPAHECREALTS